MYDKPTRRFAMLSLTMYLTLVIGLSLALITHEPQRKSEPEGNSSQLVTTNSTPKRYPIALIQDPEYVRSQARIWFHQNIDGYHEEWLCIDEIIYRESRWIPNLYNTQGSGAYGLGQVKGSDKYTKNKPLLQFKVALRYAIHRYGTPCAALKEHNKQGWY